MPRRDYFEFEDEENIFGEYNYLTYMAQNASKGPPLPVRFAYEWIALLLERFFFCEGCGARIYPERQEIEFPGGEFLPFTWRHFSCRCQLVHGALF